MQVVAQCISDELGDACVRNRKGQKVLDFANSGLPSSGDRQRTWMGSPRHRAPWSCIERVRKTGYVRSMCHCCNIFVRERLWSKVNVIKAIPGPSVL